MDLSGLVHLESVEVEEENVLGVRVPTLSHAEFSQAPYSMLAKPFWIDDLVKCLMEVVTHRLRLRVYKERVNRLHQAVRRVTQRVNLFDKVLIPNAKKNIQRIGIYLADADRAAVVNSKIAKKKRAIV